MEKLVIPNALLLGETRHLLKEGRKVTLTVKGNSMLPFIRGGRDSVQLVARDTYTQGDIVLAEISEGHYVLHRIIDITGNEPDSKVVLMGDGNIAGTETCQKKDIAGIVCLILKNGREIDPNTARERKKARIWKRLLPIRRWILAIYRRINIL